MDRSPDEQIRADAIASQLEVPVARGQPSLWLLHEGEPGSAGRSIAAALPLHGELDISALACALGALVARHAPLRAAFPYADEEPVRPIAGRAREWLQEYDARDLDDEQLAKWLEYAAHETFDRLLGPLLRIHLYRRSADQTVILVVAHQVIMDSWSMRTLVRELEMVYVEQTGGMPAPPSELAVTNGGLARLYRWTSRSRRSAPASLSPDPLICVPGH